MHLPVVGVAERVGGGPPHGARRQQSPRRSAGHYCAAKTNFHQVLAPNNSVCPQLPPARLLPLLPVVLCSRGGKFCFAPKPRKKGRLLYPDCEAWSGVSQRGGAQSGGWCWRGNTEQWCVSASLRHQQLHKSHTQLHRFLRCERT